MTTTLAPTGLYLPTDVTPETFFQAIGRLRREAQDEIERLLAFLDATEGDPDAEPSLGWTSSLGHYLETPADLIGNANFGDDRESDDSDYEPDTDLEPSLGWRGAGCFPENDSQDGVDFHLNADHGGEFEEDHDGREPSEDAERWLGWANEGPQQPCPEGFLPDCEATSPEWQPVAMV